MSVYEAGMLICFGVSWPLAAYKTYKAKCVHGKSIWFSLPFFLFLILSSVFFCFYSFLKKWRFYNLFILFIILPAQPSSALHIDTLVPRSLFRTLLPCVRSHSPQ